MTAGRTKAIDLKTMAMILFFSDSMRMFQVPMNRVMALADLVSLLGS